MRKQTKKSLIKLSIIAFAFLGAQGTHLAHADDRGQPNNNGGNAQGQSYTVKVFLSRQNGVRGELQVVDDVTGRVLRTCGAIGGRNNHPDGAPSRPTPAGRHRVDRTSPHLDYRGQANAIRNVNSTYFTSIFGRPVAIHTGSLNSNSHACVRTTAACSSYIKSKAESVNNNMIVDVRYVR